MIEDAILDQMEDAILDQMEENDRGNLNIYLYLSSIIHKKGNAQNSNGSQISQISQMDLKWILNLSKRSQISQKDLKSLKWSLAIILLPMIVGPQTWQW